jgi:ornithine cyclodeaminase/alanine dehydrogenase-like protein (mu-crystallin family)
MDSDVRIVREAELRNAVRLDQAAVEVVEKAFAALGTGKVVMPPIL